MEKEDILNFLSVPRTEKQIMKEFNIKSINEIKKILNELKKEDKIKYSKKKYFKIKKEPGKIKTIHFYYLAILILVILANQPWLRPGHPVEGGDYDFHFFKSWLAKENLIHLFERPYYWDPYNEVLFDRYYVPLGHFLIGLFAFVFNLRNAVAFTVFLCSFIGGVGVFYIGKYYLKNDKYALVSSLAYVLSSVFFYEIIQEGGFPRLFVYGLFPWVVYFFEKSFKSNKYRNTAISAVLASVCFLSHFEPGIRVLMFVLLLFFFRIIIKSYKNINTSRNFSKLLMNFFSKKIFINNLLHFLLFFILFFGLVSFHVLPAVIEYSSLKEYFDVSAYERLKPLTSVGQFMDVLIERIPLIFIPFTKMYLGPLY